MSKQTINPAPETHGDARTKINANFTEVYDASDANTAKVSADGSVTTHNDVTDAGSGAIITGTERTKLSTVEQRANHTGTQALTTVEFPSTGTHLTDLEGLINHMWSAGVPADGGFDITEEIDASVTIASGDAILRNGAVGAVGAKLAEYNIAGVSNVVIDDEATTYFVVGYNSGSPAIAWNTDLAVLFNDPTVVSIFTINRLGTELNVIDNRDFNVDFIKKNIQKDFLIERFEHAGGSSIADEGAQNFSITAGTYYILNNAAPAAALDTSVAGVFQYVYQDGAGGWTRVDSATQIDIVQYDNAGTLTDLSNSQKYGIHFVYCVLNQPSHYKVLYGQAQYDTLSEAQGAGVPAVLPSDLDGDSTAVFIGKIIIKKNIVAFADIQSPFTQTLTSTTPTVHDDLSGLNGGTVDEYFHLTAAQHIIMESGQQVVEANASEVIGKGQVVYMTGSTTNSIPDVSIASNSNFAKADVLAVATESALLGESFVIVTAGLLQGIDTSTFSEGEILYLGASGELTNIHPTGTDAVQRLGSVVVVDNLVGSMIVNIDSLTIINNHNGTMRHQIVNQNAGAFASAGYTIVNDVGHRSSLNLLGSGWGADKEHFGLYNQGYGKTIFTVDGNLGFDWNTDTTDAHAFSATTKMTLSSIGDLSVVGTINSGTFTYADLIALTVSAGSSAFCNQSLAVHAGNSGEIIASGSNFVPVYYDGTNWRIS